MLEIDLASIYSGIQQVRMQVRILKRPAHEQGCPFGSHACDSCAYLFPAWAENYITWVDGPHMFTYGTKCPCMSLPHDLVVRMVQQFIEEYEHLST